MFNGEYGHLQIAPNKENFPCSKTIKRVNFLLGSKSNVSWEVQRYDGWYNNLAYHSRGSAGKIVLSTLMDSISYEALV